MGMDIGGIITSIGVIILGYFQYNQHTKNKLTDERIRLREAEDKSKRKQLKRAVNDIVRDLHRLLIKTDAQRAYIVQPHPLDRAKFISIEYEVVSEGMTEIAQRVHRLPISSFSSFVTELSSRDFILWKSQADVKDGRARAIMHNIGTEKMAVYRMMDDDDVWLGNVVLDFDEHQKIEPVYLRDKMGEVANTIKYILPEIEE